MTANLNYKSLGTGQPLIILHGLFGSLDNWMTLAKHWSKHYQVILVDQRNHGQSFHDDQHSYPLMAQDLKEFTTTLGLKNFILLGHSMGGKTAMEFAISQPELVSKLIVVDIAPVKYDVHHHAIIEALESLDFDFVQSRTAADQELGKLIEEVGVRQFLLKNLYWQQKNKLNWRFNLDTLKKTIYPISEYSIREGTFEKPSLFIRGSRSEYVLDKYLPLIEKKFTNSKIETINGAGHWVHAEKRAEFTAVVDQFIA